MAGSGAEGAGRGRPSGRRAPPGFRQGLTVSAGAFVALLLESFGSRVPRLLPEAVRDAGATGPVLVGLLLSVSGLVEMRRRGLSAVLRIAAVLGFWVLVLPVARERAGLALAFSALGVSLLLWPGVSHALRGGMPPLATSRRTQGFVRGACLGAAATWLLGFPGGLARGAGGEAAVTLGFAAALAIGGRWAWRRRGAGGRATVAATVFLLAALLASGDLLAYQGVLLLLPVLAMGVLTVRPERGAATDVRRDEGWSSLLLTEPARLLVVSFLFLGVLGGLVLVLPPCSVREGGVSLLDALFTSFSATCVTGLVVLDTPHDFTFLGQSVILVLIQVGGLGIMTFSTTALVVLGRRLSVRHEGAVARILGDEHRGNVRRALGAVLKVTFVAEVLGAAALTALFLRHGDGLGMAAWRGTFTAVSAFCNAGFALQTDSLVGYQQEPLVLHVVALLIILGGLGPVVVVAVPGLIRRKPTTVHVRLVLFVTAVLLFAPAIFLAAVEWSSSLAHLGPLDRLSNAWFQSVTLRTAGFNSVDINALEPASVTTMMVLMFIGGSPGSTAGGIKTTTFAILVLSAWAAIRGRTRVNVFHFGIGITTLHRALAITLLGGLSVLGANLGLQLTQALAPQAAIFESVSAVGTVGLSLGATALLDSVGKVIVIFAMFAGRVGPLSLFVFLAGHEQAARVRRPEQEIPVG